MISHQEVSGPPAIQLVSLEERREKERGGGEEGEGERRRRGGGGGVLEGRRGFSFATSCKWSLAMRQHTTRVE